MFSEVQSLFANLEYMKLFTSFTLVTGAMHGVLSLINQLPTDFGNDEIGYAASAVIVCGLIGAFAVGFLLDYTKAYRTIYKVLNVVSIAALIFFLSNCRDGAYTLFLQSGGLYGFLVIPTFPATIVCAVECSYPVPEEAAAGMLFVGMSLMSIVTTFVGQVLLQMHSDGNSAPLFPFGYFIMALMFLAAVPVLTFRGEYLRLNLDSKTGSGGGGTMTNPISSGLRYAAVTDTEDDDEA